MRTKSVRGIIQLLSILFTIQCAFMAQGLQARQNKDVMLVLDTSMSMIGRAGGTDILEKVRTSISRYIDQSVQDGDRVTFVTFDTDVRIYPPVMVDDDNDRDIIKKYISMTEATGMWTYTYKMITKVFQEADKIEKDKHGRQMEIVILTDAIDDPPPNDMKRYDFKEFAKKYGKKVDMNVYVLSFTDVEKSDAGKQLFKDLGLISDNVKIIQTNDPEKGKDQLVEDEKKKEAAGRSILIPVLIAVGCIAAVLLILFLVKRLSDLKVQGKLEYWNNEVIEPYTQRFDLARRPAREVLIGKGLGCVLNIRDINIKKPFAIKAVRHEKAIRMQLIAGEGSNVEMTNRQSDGLLQDGDIFQAGNFTFKFFAS